MDEATRIKKMKAQEQKPPAEEQYTYERARFEALFNEIFSARTAIWILTLYVLMIAIADVLARWSEVAAFISGLVR